MPQKYGIGGLSTSKCSVCFVEIRHVCIFTATLTKIADQLRLTVLIEIEAGSAPVSDISSRSSSSCLTPWQRVVDGGARDAGHHGAQRATVGLLQGGVVSLMICDVQRSVEQGSSARGSHGKFVDGSVGITLGL